MLRAVWFALLFASLFTSSLPAQRGGGGSRGSLGMPAFSGYAGHRGSFNGAFPGGLGRGGFYPYFSSDFLPDNNSYWLEGREPEPLQRIIYSLPEPERAPTAAQVIEIPLTSGTRKAEPGPPAMFVLKSGEQLEARRFLLTATGLSVNIDRRQRLISLDALDLDATVSSNRQRGITLQIPSDHNEICLSF